MPKRNDYYLKKKAKKNGSFTYCARKRRNGKELEKSLDTKDEAIAHQRAKRWLEELIAQEWGEKPARTFDEAMERYSEERADSLADKTARRYAASMVHLYAHLKGVRLKDITTSILLDFERKRRPHVKPQTIRRDLLTLSSIFAMAQFWEWAETNPVLPFLKARGKMGLTEGEPRTRYLTRDEEDALLRYAENPFRDLFAFNIDTGLRRSELTNLCWPHVKLDVPNEDMIPARGHIVVEKKRTRTKGGSRIVPLVDRAYEYLKTANKRALPVFSTSRGQPHSIDSPTVWVALKAAARKAGIEDLTLHDLRRTCGCRLLQDYGASMEVVSRWLGHSSIVVTERCYAFLRVEDLHRAIEKGRENVIQIDAKRALWKTSKNP